MIPAAMVAGSGLTGGAGVASGIGAGLSGIGKFLGNNIGTIGSIAAPILGGLLGQRAASGEADAAREAREAALREFSQISIPELQAQLYKFSPDMLPEVMGEYRPEFEKSIELGPSAMEQVTVDPRLKLAQEQALSRMAEISASGLTPGDLAALEQIRRQATGEEQARQARILQEMQQRGVAGSGAELATRLASGQASAARQQEMGLEAARQAQARAFEAIGRSGAMSGQMREQEFGEASQKARAEDIINQFNVAQKQALEQRKVSELNKAQAMALAERQRVAEQIAGLRRSQEMRRAELPGEQFGRQMALASGRTGQYQGLAQQRESEAGRIAGMYGGIGQAVGTGLSGYFQGQQQSDDAEKNRQLMRELYSQK